MFLILFLSLLNPCSPQHRKTLDHYLDRWLGNQDGVYLFNYQTGKSLYKYHPKVLQKRFIGGSVFKLISAHYLLQTQDPDTLTAYCSGIARFHGRIGRCSKHSGHNAINLKDAVIQSCNHFFYHQYQQIDPDQWLTLAHQLGVLHHLKKMPQSPFLYAGVPPELSLNYYEAASLITFFATAIPQTPQFKMKKWLRDVILFGTASHVHFKGLGLSGKTGTGLDHQGRYNGVFIGYLTRYPYGIVVNLHQKIGTNAAMIAGDVFYLLTRKKGKNQTK